MGRFGYHKKFLWQNYRQELKYLKASQDYDSDSPEVKESNMYEQVLSERYNRALQYFGKSLTRMESISTLFAQQYFQLSTHNMHEINGGINLFFFYIKLMSWSSCR